MYSLNGRMEMVKTTCGQNNTLKWTKGFHSGRYFLMDMRRRLTAEYIYPKEEHDFIVKQNHIDDMFK